MRRRVDVRWRLQAGDFVKLGQQQERLLDTGLKLLKPGGTLVYSTCSIDADENQEVVRRVLANHPSARLEEEICWLPSINRFDGAYAARISVQ
jgi:16S rRNA (cytosine967-C5)-methyltransferase